MLSGLEATSARRPANPIAAPTAPPISASSTPSVRNCRSSRQRPAPSADRIANSFCRDSARASSRLARLAHAISSTNATAPCSTNSAVRMPPTRSSCSPSSRMPVPGLARHVRVAIELTPLLQHALDVCVGLRHADAVFQPADEVQEVSAAVARIGGVERQGQPDLRLRVVDVVPRRHDADDARRRAVDGDHAPDDRFVAAERGAPDFARQHRHVFRAGQRVGPRELPAADRGDPEHGHQLGRDQRGVDAPRLIRRAEVDGAGPIAAHVLEGLVPLAELEELGRRDPELIEPEARELARDEDQPRGVRIRQRLEDHAVDDAEDGRVGADPQRQRQHRHERVAGVLPEVPQRV